MISLIQPYMSGALFADSVQDRKVSFLLKHGVQQHRVNISARAKLRVDPKKNEAIKSWLTIENIFIEQILYFLKSQRDSHQNFADYKILMCEFAIYRSSSNQRHYLDTE